MSSNNEVSYDELNSYLESHSIEETLSTPRYKRYLLHLYGPAVDNLNTKMMMCLMESYNKSNLDFILHGRVDSYGKYAPDEVSFVMEAAAAISTPLSPIDVHIDPSFLTEDTIDIIIGCLRVSRVGTLTMLIDEVDLSLEDKYRLIDTIISTSSDTLESITWYPGDTLDTNLVITLIEKCEKLDYLSISGEKITDEDVMEVCYTASKRPTKWRYFGIGSDSSTMKSLKGVIEMVRADSVECLEITSNEYQWTDELLEALRASTNLRDIHITYEEPFEEGDRWIRVNEEKYPGYVQSRRLLGINYMNLLGDIVECKKG